MDRWLICRKCGYAFRHTILEDPRFELDVLDCPLCEECAELVQKLRKISKTKTNAGVARIERLVSATLDQLGGIEKFAEEYVDHYERIKFATRSRLRKDSADMLLAVLRWLEMLPPRAPKTKDGLEQTLMENIE